MAGNSTHIPDKTSACTRPNNVLGLLQGLDLCYLLSYYWISDFGYRLELPSKTMMMDRFVIYCIWWNGMHI